MSIPVLYPLPILPPDAPKWAYELLQALDTVLRTVSLELNQKVLMGTTPPSADGSGRFFFNTSTKKLYFDDGQWNEV